MPQIKKSRYLSKIRYNGRNVPVIQFDVEHRNINRNSIATVNLEYFLTRVKKYIKNWSEKIGPNFKASINILPVKNGDESQFLNLTKFMSLDKTIDQIDDILNGEYVKKKLMSLFDDDIDLDEIPISRLDIWMVPDIDEGGCSTDNNCFYETLINFESISKKVLKKWKTAKHFREFLGLDDFELIELTHIPSIEEELGVSICVKDFYMSQPHIHRVLHYF